MPKVTKNYKAMENMIEPKKLEFGKKYFFQVLSMCPLAGVASVSGGRSDRMRGARYPGMFSGSMVPEAGG